MTQKVLFIVLAILSLSFLSSPLALLAGFIFALFFANPFEKFTQLGIKYILKIAIVGLGFSIHTTELEQAGLEGLGFTAISITLILIMGFYLGKRLKIDKKLSFLISSGTAICGGSAIAAVSSVIKPRSHQISIALGAVFYAERPSIVYFSADWALSAHDARPIRYVVCHCHSRYELGGGCCDELRKRGSKSRYHREIGKKPLDYSRFGVGGLYF